MPGAGASAGSRCFSTWLRVCRSSPIASVSTRRWSVSARTDFWSSRLRTETPQWDDWRRIPNGGGAWVQPDAAAWRQIIPWPVARRDGWQPWPDWNTGERRREGFRGTDDWRYVLARLAAISR